MEPGGGGRLPVKAFNRLDGQTPAGGQYLQGHCAIQRNLAGLIDDAHAAAPGLADDLEVAKPPVLQRPLPGRRHGHPLWMGERSRPLRPNGPRRRCRTIDSERPARATALRQARELAKEASRARSDFLANVSHEVRTPLGAILVFAEMLLDPVLPPLEQDHALQAIRHSGQHLLQIINDIRNLSNQLWLRHLGP